MALLVLLFASNDPAVVAQQPSAPVASEYNLKLARLYATCKFIEWPATLSKTEMPFVIGVLEPDPFDGGLQKLARRKLGDRQIQVQIIKTAEEYRFCHLLFIPSQASHELIAAVLKRIENQSVLVWRDEPDDTTVAGVACTFIRDGDSLLIEADPTELKRRRLIPAAQLLSLNMIRVVRPDR